MKLRLRRGIAALTAVTAMLAVTTAAASNGVFADIFRAGNSLDTLMETLEDMPGEELLHAVSEAADAVGTDLREDTFMYFATALSVRADEFTDDELTAVAMNESQSELMRILAVQILGQKHNYAFAEGELLALLDSDTVSQDIRNTIIVSCDFSDAEGQAKLEQLATGADPDVAFQALKKLQKVDLDAAAEIADEIIAQYESVHPTITCAAIKAKSKQLRVLNEKSRASDAEIEAFIDFCKTFHASTEEQIEQDTAILGIADLHCEAGIRTILEEESFDLKVGAISKNLEVLYHMIQTEPTTDDIMVVCEAMKLHPHTEFEKPLRELREMVPQVFSSEDTERLELLRGIDAALERIDEEGITSKNPLQGVVES